MHTHQLHFHLRRLSQNAKALADLCGDGTRPPGDLTGSAKMRLLMREDLDAVEREFADGQEGA